MRAFLRALGNAVRGISALLKTQANARIHLCATVLVIALGLLVGLASREWAILAVAISLVWSAEAMNSALEHLADHFSPERHPLVGRAKDVAAAAVLLTALGALVAGVLIFSAHL